MKIGERIKARREELHMSQEELAKRLGYTNKTAISKVENDKIQVSALQLIKYAEALETSEKWLLGLSESELKADYNKLSSSEGDTYIKSIEKKIDGLKEDELNLTFDYLQTKNEIITLLLKEDIYTLSDLKQIRNFIQFILSEKNNA